MVVDCCCDTIDAAVCLLVLRIPSSSNIKNSINNNSNIVSRTLVFIMSTAMELQIPEEMNTEAEQMEVRLRFCCSSDSAFSKDEEAGVQ